MFLLTKNLDLLGLHTDMVRKVVPADRLLVVNLGDGWEPLCNFLGKPIPQEPYPQANEREAAAREGKKIFAKCLVVWTGLFSVAGVGIYAGVRIWKR